MKKVLIIGAGGVGHIVAHKCAKNSDVFSHIMIASRTFQKCQRIMDDINKRNESPIPLISVSPIDAGDVNALQKLIQSFQADILITCSDPYLNSPIMEACIREKIHYIDTSISEKEGEINLPPDKWYELQYTYADGFKKAGVVAGIGLGSDPGMVNIFCSYSQKYLFDQIDSIRIMDINDGDHGFRFATNFNPEVNLKEIFEDPHYWSNKKWHRIQPHSKSMVFDFPEIGKRKIYTMGHDEVHSLYRTINANHVEFLMGFSDDYIQYFKALMDIGLLSVYPVRLDDGRSVVPLKVVKAVLPDPSSLAKNYKGKVCIGCLIDGYKEGKYKKIFIYNITDHEETYKETGSQAISYTAGVPAVTSAILIAKKLWHSPGMHHAEEFNPDPFMEEIVKQGLPWKIIDKTNEHE